MSTNRLRHHVTPMEPSRRLVHVVPLGGLDGAQVADPLAGGRVLRQRRREPDYDLTGRLARLDE